MGIIYDFKVKFHNSKWRKLNKHNDTSLGTLAPIGIINVGNESYGKLNVHFYGNENEKLIIGNYCSIASDVHFITGGGHDYGRLFTFPLINRLTNRNENESTTKGPIIIEDDVWIGFGSIILSGVRIGKGAVIGAGSVVSKDVPPFAIFCGDKIKKYRFDDNKISLLKSIDYTNLTLETLSKFKDLLREPLNDELLKTIENEIILIKEKKI